MESEIILILNFNRIEFPKQLVHPHPIPFLEIMNPIGGSEIKAGSSI